MPEAEMRKDGKRLKRIDPMYTIMPYFLRERSDAMNMITIDIPMEPIQSYINAKRKENCRISHMSVIIAATIRAMAEYPALNRFIVNKKIYARNELCVGMVVMKPGKLEGTMNKMYFEFEDTVFDVQKVIDSYVDQNRQEGETNTTDKIISLLLSQQWLLEIGTFLFRWLDKHNLLPRALIEASPFHVSFSITNLASIRTNHIYHHIYNFGTTSIFLAMGNTREVLKRDPDGNIDGEKCIPIGVVMDERVADGAYFAAAFAKMKAYLKNPSLLEVPPTVINRDFPKEENWHHHRKADE